MADPVVHITNGVPDSGTGNITTLGAVVTALGSPLQAGGSVAISSGSVTVSGAVGISGTLPAFAATPTVNIGTAPSIAVTGTFYQATQPVSIATVKAASTAPVASDTALVVSISPNSINANGQATMTNSAPVVLASNQTSIPVASTLTAETTKVIGTVNVSAAQTIGTTNATLTNVGAGEYETVAASQTAQVLGATGATGDYVAGILVIPANTSPGLVTLLDGATSIPVFVGGAGSVATLHPFLISLGMISVSGAWKITTGASVSCIGIGNFT